MKFLIVIALCMFASQKASAQENQLTVSPKKCVALKKGQLCYQTILVHFKTSIENNFCLIVNEEKEPLQCWTNSKAAEYRYRLASKSGAEFRVIDSNQQTLGAANVTVAWVYKQSRKRNRWRLF